MREREKKREIYGEREIFKGSKTERLRKRAIRERESAREITMREKEKRKVN